MNLRHTFTHHPGHELDAHLASLVNVLAGIYLFLSPWIFPANLNTAGAWNAVVAGFVVAILAFDHMSLIDQFWLSWINAAVGVWIIISPWVFGYSADIGMTWSCVITGLVVIVLAVVAALDSPPQPER